MTHADNNGDTTEQTEKRYYYHADHLQSAQFITNAKGEQYEHIEYTPYGELWIEETAPGIDKLPFRFTGKELDEETGLYYYGARYLDPKYSRWLSGDPALNDYIPKATIDDEAKKHNENLPGMGGVFNTVNLHVYHYAGNNPVKYVDPDGDKILDVSTTLFQESGGNTRLGWNGGTIAGYGCVLTAYTRIANAIIREEYNYLDNDFINVESSNLFATAYSIYEGVNENLLCNNSSGPELINFIASIFTDGTTSEFAFSVQGSSLNFYGKLLENLKSSDRTYAVTIRLSSGHTVNLNSDGIQKDSNGNYTLKINNTSENSNHNYWRPNGMTSDVIDNSDYILRIDIFSISE
nr:RHS repeat-associated core domain-containing protein [Treponema sp. OMZ 788]